MTARPVRGRWRAEVLRSSAITDSVRVLLVLLADHMTEGGRVSQPRSRLAEQLGRSERRVAERIEAAIDAGLLTRVERGRVGRTATYAAAFPSAKGADGHPRARGRTTAPSRGRTGAPYLHAPKGADGGHTNSYPADPYVRDIVLTTSTRLAPVLQAEERVDAEPGSRAAEGAA